MAEKKKKKNKFEFLTKKFPKRMQGKLVMLFMAILLAFVVLIVRITFINATKGSGYTKIVLDQQEYSSRTIPFKRGDIVDRNGTKIATSERVYNVILDVYVMSDKDAYLDPTVKVLVDCFGLDEDEVRETIEENEGSRYVVMSKGIDYDTAKAFEKIDEDDENYPNVKGIWLEEDYKRTYPYGSLACDVIGFSVSGNVGAIGLESAYNDVLNGTDGREYGYFADKSSVERTVKAAKNGNTVVSTIDVTLQSIVEQYILEFNERHKGEADSSKLGSQNTAVIIMDPNTGEILAMASYPNFDLNSPRDLSLLYSDDEWDAMTDEEQLDAMNELWRNFCISDAYEPGSVAKPFTVAAALETNAITGDEGYQCDGYLHVGDNNIACHNRDGHGWVSVQDSMAYSCNVALMKIAEAMGTENFIRYQHIFGFGEYTGIDLPGEAYTEGLLYDTETMKPVDLATNSFGQCFNVSMIQMASAFCSLINGGYYYEPHIVKQIQDEDGKVVETRDPVLLRKTISEETCQQLKPYLKSVLDYGTAKDIVVEGYDIAGKTGTAEKLPRNNGKHLISFMGFAPVENPEVLVYVVIDEANVADQSLGSYVRRLAESIMREAFPYLGITTIEDASMAENQQNTWAAEPEETYTDHDANYTDTYQNEDGNYTNENYDPDHTDWVSGSTPEE